MSTARTLRMCRSGQPFDNSRSCRSNDGVAQLAERRQEDRVASAAAIGRAAGQSSQYRERESEHRTPSNRASSRGTDCTGRSEAATSRYL